MRTEADNDLRVRPGRSYARFLAEAVGILAALLVVGWPATLRLAGEAALPAMFAGAGLALLAAVAGTLPLVRARGRAATERIPAFLGALALRFTVALVLAVAAALSGLFAPAPLLVWLLLCHLALLVADTRYALTTTAAPGPEPRPPASLEPALEKR